MSQFHFDPATYDQLMEAEVPGYDRLQARLAGAATGDLDGVERILDLGVGTGVTAARVLAVHPDATLVGVDESEAMLGAARAVLDATRVELVLARLQDPLPAGPFDLVVSALAVHHLDGAEKADLFVRLAAALRPGGRFVLADVVIPDDPDAVVTPIDDDGWDKPDRVDDQLAWLRDAGFAAEVVWTEGDLAVLVANRPGA